MLLPTLAICGSLSLLLLTKPALHRLYATITKRRRLRKIRKGYPLVRTSYIHPNIRGDAPLSWQPIAPDFGYTVDPEIQKWQMESRSRAIYFINQFIAEHFPVRPEGFRKVPLDAVSVQIALADFQVLGAHARFRPADARRLVNYLTFQKISPNVQLTFYNEKEELDGETVEFRFLAGITYFPVEETDTELEAELMKCALRQADPYYQHPRHDQMDRYSMSDDGTAVIYRSTEPEPIESDYVLR